MGLFELDTCPIGICVGRYQYSTNLVERILDFSIVAINSYARSLCVEVSGMLSINPPIIVEV